MSHLMIATAFCKRQEQKPPNDRFIRAWFLTSDAGGAQAVRPPQNRVLRLLPAAEAQIFSPTGVSEARPYNNANQTATIIATKGGNIRSTYTYTLDDAGNRTAVQDGSGTESYAFDNLYRLTQVSYTDSTSQYYCYDWVGNRTSMSSTTGCGGTSYTCDNGDRCLLQRTGFSRQPCREKR